MNIEFYKYSIIDEISIISPFYCLQKNVCRLKRVSVYLILARKPPWKPALVHHTFLLPVHRKSISSSISLVCSYSFKPPSFGLVESLCYILPASVCFLSKSWHIGNSWIRRSFDTDYKLNCVEIWLSVTT